MGVFTFLLDLFSFSLILLGYLLTDANVSTIQHKYSCTSVRRKNLNNPKKKQTQSCELSAFLFYLWFRNQHQTVDDKIERFIDPHA